LIQQREGASRVSCIGRGNLAGEDETGLVANAVLFGTKGGGTPRTLATPARSGIDPGQREAAERILVVWEEESSGLACFRNCCHLLDQAKGTIGLFLGPLGERRRCQNCRFQLGSAGLRGDER
jgi:hypothetical protein